MNIYDAIFKKYEDDAPTEIAYGNLWHIDAVLRRRSCISRTGVVGLMSDAIRNCVHS